MEELKLIPFGDPQLKNKPEKFNFEVDDPEILSEQLFIAMNKFGGVGLSANQVGINKRVFVIGGSGIEEKAIFNPE